ncbi:MAG TPA: hemolysin family protein [Lentisphaeria bacterium]|nr:HlyC/CorC family transporter [Lentisphaerota bacterium]OQC16383.1 MAG: Magnesium and cobalt efflux protein CorC [Lentisphaerae bacterium ADurb.Bin082]HPY90031.1 hemolysin family protein [Lentisphaeria bacterium]HQC51536.1 hemolysin family protein [Lentisphaeria bacterium]HQL87923.1 hemolysin family protein [Lentisphaeria bacterium]
MNPLLWLYASITITIINAVLTLACLELGQFSGGKLRRLEDVNEKLAERLDAWFPPKDEWRFTSRLVVLIAFMLLTYCFSEWEQAMAASGYHAFTRFALPSLFILIGYALVELTGQFISIVASARFLCVFIPFYRFLSWILFPLIWPITIIAQRLREQQATRNATASGPTAEDEILSLIENSWDGDNPISGIEEDERRMILGAFALDQTFVHEIMTPRVDVDGVEVNDTIADVRRTIVESGHSRIPLYDNSIDHILGVIYAKDLLDEKKLAKVTSLRDLAHPAVFIPETKNIGDLMEEFRQSTNQFAIVLDEYGGTAGIVTFEDILEEIVGDIHDEYDDKDMSDVEQQEDGSYIVDGRLPIWDVNDLLGTNISEEEDFDTLGGYISTFLGKIPEQGAHIETDQIIADILEANPRRIVRLSIRNCNQDSSTEKD